MLLADPMRVNLFKCLCSNDVYLLRGLLQQHNVDVNRLVYIDMHSTTRSTSTNAAITDSGCRVVATSDTNSTGSDAVTATALMVAVYLKQMDEVNILLNNTQVNVNLRNGSLETSLMWCAVNSPSRPPPVPAGGGVSSAGDHDNHDDYDDGCRMELALCLLRAGADRYARDQHGQTAYAWSVYGGVSGRKLQARSSVATTSGGSSGRDTSTLDIDTEPFNRSICVFPRLAAVLYYNPEIFFIYDLARTGNLGGVQALIEQGVNVNTSCPRLQYTPLIAAVHNQDIAMVDYLLQNAYVDVNKHGLHGMTPLHYAAQSGNTMIAGMLLRFGADRNAMMETQLTALDFAAAKGYDAICDSIRFDPKKVSVCLAAKHGDMKVSIFMDGGWI